MTLISSIVYIIECKKIFKKKPFFFFFAELTQYFFCKISNIFIIVIYSGFFDWIKFTDKPIPPSLLKYIVV